jgi:ubiquinone/menaquinone biosynthesis C-methylase UbiE
MTDDSRLFEVFLDVQRGLPRQGPGCAESTRKALSLCKSLPEEPRVLDIGCGPGMQTQVLAEDLGGEITAVDVMEEYLDALRERIGAMAALDRVKIMACDMSDLPFPEHAFDLIWSEGAAYIMGVENALKQWRPLLKPRGYLALTELVWLEAGPPADAVTFFGEEYPAMTDVVGVAHMFRQNGYDVVGHFTLPDAAWWESYYGPLALKLPGLNEKYKGDNEALSVVETIRREIEVRRLFGESYGYQFFVGQRLGVE